MSSQADRMAGQIDEIHKALFTNENSHNNRISALETGYAIIKKFYAIPTSVLAVGSLVVGLYKYFT